MCFIFYFSGIVKERVEWGNANTDDATTPITQISGERGAQNKQIRRDVLICSAVHRQEAHLAFIYLPPIFTKYSP